MAEVEWSEDALASLDAICLGIAADSPQARKRLPRGCSKQQTTSRSFRHAGRIVPEIKRDDIRELIVGNYRLIYLVRGELVRVALVWYGARLLDSDPGKMG